MSKLAQWSILVCACDPKRGTDCMGVVLPFITRPLMRGKSTAGQVVPAIGAEQAVLAVVREKADRGAVLAAAEPLLQRVRDRYGFAVMHDGLPEEPEALATALVGLLRGLTLLDSDIGQRRALSTFGVYFGHRELAWFDDGYGGSTALAVPDRVLPDDLARFVRPRLNEALC
jgi:hypothetical protein